MLFLHLFLTQSSAQTGAYMYVTGLDCKATVLFHVHHIHIWLHVYEHYQFLTHKYQIIWPWDCMNYITKATKHHIIQVHVHGINIMQYSDIYWWTYKNLQVLLIATSNVIHII